MQPSKLDSSDNPSVGLGTTNRLAFTLVIAVIFHAMLTFGVNPTIVQKVKRTASSIEVNLVRNHLGTTVDQETQHEEVKVFSSNKQGHASKLLRQNEEPSPQMDTSTLKIPVAKKIPLIPNAKQLINRALAMASLRGEIQSELKSNDTKSRHKYITINTKEYKYAAYMEAWRAKVERIGNINYPNKAREKKLSGNLSLDVSLKRDGTVKEINIRRSSGHEVLDDAAIQIVRLAAPFAPFPKNIQDEVDILHVTRTWKFVNDQNFSTH
jgi:TonB family protein